MATTCWLKKHSILLLEMFSAAYCILFHIHFYIAVYYYSIPNTAREVKYFLKMESHASKALNLGEKRERNCERILSEHTQILKWEQIVMMKHIYCTEMWGSSLDSASLQMLVFTVGCAAASRVIKLRGSLWSYRVQTDIKLLTHIHTTQHTIKKTNLPRYPVSLHQVQLNITNIKTYLIL